MLEDGGFDNLPALLSTDCHDPGGLKLKKDHITFVFEETKAFQIKHGEGPLCTSVSTCRENMAGPDLVRLLGSLTVVAEGAQAQKCTACGCHQITDFVLLSLLVEEEVALGNYHTRESTYIRIDSKCTWMVPPTPFCSKKDEILCCLVHPVLCTWDTLFSQ